MVHTMNKPPKNFEDLVVGHFHMHVHDIQMACKAYMEGLQGGCLVSGINETYSIEFKNEVESCIKPLVDAFSKIGAKEAQEFLPLVKKRKVVVDEEINDAINKKTKVVFDENVNDAVNEKRKDIVIGHGSDSHYVPWSWKVTAHSCPCLVTKLLVKDGMKVKAQQPLFVKDATYMREVFMQMHTPSSATQPESAIQKILEVKQSSRVGVFSMEDTPVDRNDAENIPIAGLDNKHVRITYTKFKKFDYRGPFGSFLFNTECSYEPCKCVSVCACIYT